MSEPESNPSEAPRSETVASPEAEPAIGSRWHRIRTWLAVLLLAAYPIVLGSLGAVHAASGLGPLLPTDATALWRVTIVELLIFGGLLGLVLLLMRPGVNELRLPWRSGLHPLWRGVVYSVALRVGIMIVLVVVLYAFLLVSGGSPEAVRGFAPKTTALVDPEALSKDVTYFVLNLTVVSFVLAGLREELWRAAMLAGLARLVPSINKSWPQTLWAIGLVAVTFGLGHLSQGWGGAASTALLGFGLGVIMVWHNSIWDAVLAHGFFNATSFTVLYLLAKYAPEALKALTGG